MAVEYVNCSSDKILQFIDSNFLLRTCPPVILSSCVIYKICVPLDIQNFTVYSCYIFGLIEADCEDFLNISLFDILKSIENIDGLDRKLNITLTEFVINCRTDHELDLKDENGQTPLLLSALYGNEFVFILIQNRNITYTVTNKLGENVLHQAVFSGNLNILDSVLQRNEVALNSYDFDGNTVMHFVALEKPKDNITEICERLLEAGAVANIKNNNHMTPFHIALQKSTQLTFKILETILENKIDGYDIQDYAGRTPLQISLDNNDDKIFNLFIEHNANPYYTDFNGRTIIHNAVLKQYGLKYLEIIFSSNKTFRGDSNRIIHPKEGLNIKDIQGYTALHLAAENGFEEKFDIIYNQVGVNVSTVNQYEETILFSAVKGGIYTIVEKILNTTKVRNNFINLQNKEGTTALHLSVEEGRTDIIRLLLNNSADPFQQDLNDLSPIALSASYSRLEIVRLFSNFDYKVTEMLALSVSNGNDEEVIKYFLGNDTLRNLAFPYQLAAARGKDNDLLLINITNTTAGSNFSEIMNFITKDHKIILTELAEDDEDESSLPFNSDHSLINLALFFEGSLKTIQILMNGSSQEEIKLLSDANVTWSPVDIAAFRNKTDIVNYLLELNGNLINRVDLKNQTAMHKAAWGGQCNVIETLFDRKKKLINMRDMFGRTPLHVAAMRGYTNAVRCILKLDVKSIHNRDEYEFTPLHLAEIYGHHKFFTALQYTSMTLPSSARYVMRYPGVRNRKRNHTSTVELLLRLGADPNAQDKTFGWTTLHWAAANGDLEAVKMLVSNGARVNIPSHSDQTPLYLARFWGRRNVYEYLKAQNAVW